MTLNVITVQNTTKFLTNVILWKLDFIQYRKKIDILRNMKEEARLLMILRLTVLPESTWVKRRSATRQRYRKI